MTKKNVVHYNKLQDNAKNMYKRHSNNVKLQYKKTVDLETVTTKELLTHVLKKHFTVLISGYAGVTTAYILYTIVKTYL